MLHIYGVLSAFEEAGILTFEHVNKFQIKHLWQQLIPAEDALLIMLLSRVFCFLACLVIRQAHF